ncbi:hypothetical protein Syun_001224 [Stephania yunnanensis]|uniref:Uncharacterized protein n=1 Tax=Stephania yunnanensis TaxID=152371 RepID=A0AAP0LIZ3_9MAGN
MARSVKKMGSIDTRLRFLVSAKLVDDDKLIEYNALLLDQFLDIFLDLHGDEIREIVNNVTFLCGYLND